MRVSPRLSAAFVIAACAALAVRLLNFTDTFAVNVLYWDEWDFLAPYFNGDSLATKFLWQHGPIRQGVGAIAIEIIYRLTNWNSRVESFFEAGVVCIAAALALWTKRRLIGPLRPLDVFIPLIYLTLNQWEMVAVTVNPAHGPLPLLLVTWLAFSTTMASRRWRVLNIALATILATYTGFGVFLGLVGPVLLALEVHQATESRDRALFATALACTLGAFAGFFVHYRFVPAVDCFKFPDPHPSRYLLFIGEFYFQRTGVVLEGGKGVVLYGALLVGLIALALRSWWLAFFREDRVALVVAALSSYVLLFAVNSAIGRTCIGAGAGLASRYVDYSSLAWFAVYLWLIRLLPESQVARDTVLVLFTMAALGERVDRSGAGHYMTRKKAWVRCYLQTHSIQGCDAAGGPIYPVPVGTHMQEKLDYLEKNKLNLFSE